MSGKESELTSRETRKRILIMESDLNRAGICHDCSELLYQLGELGAQVHAATSIATTFFRTFTPTPRAKEEDRGEANHNSHSDKPSWGSTLMRGLRLGTSLWLAFKNRS